MLLCNIIMLGCRYVDDEGSIKDLPINLRASEIATCCGKAHAGQRTVLQLVGRKRYTSCSPFSGLQTWGNM